MGVDGKLCQVVCQSSRILNIRLLDCRFLSTSGSWKCGSVVEAGGARFSLSSRRRNCCRSDEVTLMTDDLLDQQLDGGIFKVDSPCKHL